MKVLNRIILGLITAFLVISSAYADEVKSGESLFKKCAACHGVDAQKKALGQSAIIAQMDADEIYSALEGYKAGTYGRGMKVLMKNQISMYDQDELKALSEYISDLKQ